MSDKSTHKQHKAKHTARDAPMNDEQGDAFVAKLFESIEGGATLKDIQGIPDTFMKGIYTYAHEFYNQGRLDDAEVFFRFLSIYDFYNADYMMGLAAVYQLKKRYEKALELYSLAYAIPKKREDRTGPGEYRAMFYAGQCNIMLKKGENAKRCFEMVIENSTDEELKKKATIYLETLNNQQTEMEHLHPTE